MRFGISSASAAAFAAAAFFATAHGAEFALVRNGTAVAAFAFGTMPDEKAKASAEKDVALFNKHLKEVAGCELSAQNAAGGASRRNVIRIVVRDIATGLEASRTVSLRRAR